MTKQPGNQLNLDDYANKHNLKLEIVPEEHADEREFRLQQRAADARLGRFKDGVLLAVAMIFIITLGGSCLAISVSHQSTAEDKKWAWSTLTLITGAVLGFLFGRASGPR